MDKSLSLNEIRTRATQFVIDWRDAKGDEKQEDQSFIRELLNVFGVSESRAALYQKRVQRSSTGNQGYIDALIPGLVLIEMKSVGKNLGLAEIQALDYIQHLEEAEVPRYVLSSDFKRFRLLDLHGQKGKDTSEFLLEELPKNIETLGFLAGYETRSFGNREQEEASIKAAKIMGGLYEALEGSGYGDHEASIFLVRTLFALYADDSGVWQKDLFTEFLRTRTSDDGTDLGPQLTMLFQTMNQPTDRRLKNLDELLARFPYVNGGIFAEALPIPAFDFRMRTQLLNACDFNWSSISPAVFGSLFQAVKSAEARRELGEHYTTEKNILKTIEPLFLDDLKIALESARNQPTELKKLRQRLSQIRVFDPACGCGNFLVVSYRELRALELQIILRLQELGDMTSIPTLYFNREDLSVRLENITGIEIEEWPARIAQTALLLTEHQANLAMQAALGRAPGMLPLESVTGVHVGNSLRMDWTTIIPPSDQVMVIGNPPFLGDISRSAAQKEDLHYAWGRQNTSRLDFVTAWYAKSLAFFRDPAYRGMFAFVSTNSVTQGDQVSQLFPPIFEDGWRIKFAHRTFAWTSEAPGAAAVHCVILGFDQLQDSAAIIYEYPSPKGDPLPLVAQTAISPYLVDAPPVIVQPRRKPLHEGLPEAVFGNKPTDGGNLIVEAEHYETFAADPIASKYLRNYVMGRELIHGEDRWCLWMVDLEPQDLTRSKLLRERVEAVRQFRLKSTAASTRKSADTPHLFTQRPHREVPHLGIPVVSSERRKFIPAARIEASVIAGDKVYIAEDPEGFAFAIVSSSAFMCWQQAVGGRLESRLSFRNTLTWNTFPLPPIAPELRASIIRAGLGVLSARALFPARSLAEHYDPLVMDPTLLSAHAELDVVVDKAFGARKRLNSHEERQTVLFESFIRLTSTEI